MKTGTLINGLSAAVSLTSGGFDLGDLTGCGIHCAFTGGGGNLAGTLKLQASKNDVNANYVDITGSSQAVTASANHEWNVTSAQYQFIRAVWTASSGTGNLTIEIQAKENVVKGM